MLVLETLLYSRLSEVGDRPLEELLQYCTEDQNAIEPAQEVLQYCIEDQDAIELVQDTVQDCPLEDSDQLSSPLDRMDSRTLSNSELDFSEYVNFPSSDMLSAGDSEFGLNIAVIEARNNIILNTKEEFYPSQASRLDNEFLLSPTVIYQSILNKFELLVS
jgi:hypothetical protein